MLQNHISHNHLSYLHSTQSLTHDGPSLNIHRNSSSSDQTAQYQGGVQPQKIQKIQNYHGIPFWVFFGFFWVFWVLLGFIGFLLDIFEEV